MESFPAFFSKGMERTSDSPADQRRSMSVKVGRGEARASRAVVRRRAMVVRTRMVALAVPDRPAVGGSCSIDVVGWLSMRLQDASEWIDRSSLSAGNSGTNVISSMEVFEVSPRLCA